MSSLKSHFIQTLRILLIALPLLTLVSYASSTWVDATVPPTGNNVDAPINSSSTSQSKIGALLIATGAGITQGLTVLNGQVVFGSTTATSSLLLGVNGAIGATKYCDQNGNNCVTPPLSAINIYEGTYVFPSTSGVNVFTTSTGKSATTYTHATVSYRGSGFDGEITDIEVVSISGIWNIQITTSKNANNLDISSSGNYASNPNRNFHYTLLYW